MKGALTREAALDETRRIAGAVRIPVSVDAENGYGHTPEEVAETIRRVADTGAVGASIEDFSPAYGTGALYDRDLAVARIEAAVATAASLPFPFTLTARAECYLVGHPNPFEESVARANSYRDAGADCLYVPGMTDAETIGRLVKEVDAPVNVVMGLAGGARRFRNKPRPHPEISESGHGADARICGEHCHGIRQHAPSHERRHRTESVSTVGDNVSSGCPNRSWRRCSPRKNSDRTNARAA